MSKLKYIIIAMAVAVAATACTANDPVIFDDAFVYIEDSNGNNSSEVTWESNAYLATYYIKLVTPAREGNLEVTYEMVIGDGLTEGLDYNLVASTASPVTFINGIYSMPVRVEWLRNALDSTKDNTFRIVLTSCSDPDISIGKPGPDKKGSEYVITKK